MRWWMWILLLFASYDISCIYGANWLTRLGKMTGISQVWPEIRRCVPKWHAPAHTGWCRWLMSFYYTPGVGQTDGEEPERRWSVLNAIGRIVREMLAGHRQDTINLHYADYNIQKMFGLSEYCDGDQSSPTIEHTCPYSGHTCGQAEESRGICPSRTQTPGRARGYPFEERLPNRRMEGTRTHISGAASRPFGTAQVHPQSLRTRGRERYVYRLVVHAICTKLRNLEPTLKMIQEKWNHTEIAAPEPSKKRRRRGKAAAKEKPPAPTLGALFLQALDIERDQYVDM